jgi:hypothetical protein
VDDPELTCPEDEVGDEGDGSGRPIVTAILSGRGALAHRMGGRLGRLAQSLSRRLVPDGAPHGRIAFGDVSEINDHVTVATDATELATYAVDHVLREAVIERIPGAERDDGSE